MTNTSRKLLDDLHAENRKLHEAISLFLGPLEEGECCRDEWNRRVKRAVAILHEIRDAKKADSWDEVK